MSKRNFSASTDNINFYGKFSGSTPMIAAKKFINTLDTDKKHKIFIKDKINDKIYRYEGSKVKLDNPNIINLSNGKTITFNYNNNINRIF